LTKPASIIAAPTRATEPQIVQHFVFTCQTMCEAQRIDLEAAREGKMTWRAYFNKWGLG
jgi:hypothetical protein